MGELQESSTWWSKLPEDLKMNVLAWLPWECLCRYGDVCKQWNALFSSTEFITERWAVSPPNKKPCLVMYDRRSPQHCMVYCFFTETWKTISLSFLEGYYYRHQWLATSTGAGLFLVTLLVSRGRNIRYRVFNPLTGASLKLPDINYKTTVLGIRFMQGGEGHHRSTYKVVALAQSGNSQRVEIYDSSSKSWTTAGHLPKNLQATSWLSGKNMVLCEDVLYIFANTLDFQRMGILAFNILNEGSIFTPLPHVQGGYSSRSDHLFSCESQVLIGTCIDQGNVIIISDFDKDIGIFREITRIASKEFLRAAYFDFEGIGELICIKCFCYRQVFVYVYNLNDNLWKRLPSCPRITSPRDTTIFAFGPRLDMKVD